MLQIVLQFLSDFIVFFLLSRCLNNYHDKKEFLLIKD